MCVCFIALLYDVLVRLENSHNLKPIVEKLRSAFDLLVMEVEDTLKAKSVSLLDVKKFIIRKLHNIHILEEQKMAEYRQKLHGIQDMDSLFDDFLLKYYFISYLNYALLKEISQLAEDQIIASKFEKYEELYVKLTSKATFKDIISTFLQNPDLKPIAPIGLPKIIFHLEDHWQGKTFFDFINEFGLRNFESVLLSDLKMKCIIITYAVFPSVLSDVLQYFKSSAVQKKFQEMGVSVELPDLGKTKSRV